MPQGKRNAAPRDAVGLIGKHPQGSLFLLAYAVLIVAMFVSFLFLSRVAANANPLTGVETSAPADPIIGRRASTGEGDDSWRG